MTRPASAGRAAARHELAGVSDHAAAGALRALEDAATLALVPSLIGPDNVLVFPSGRPSSLPMPSVPLAMYGQATGLTLVDGRPISFARIYRTQPMVASAINALGRQMARLPLHSFERLTETSRRRDRASGLAALLAGPDPEHARSPLSLKWEVALGLWTNGNALERVHKRTPGAEPHRLTRMIWAYTIPHLSGGNVVAWEYRPPDGPVEFLGPEEVIHFRFAGPEGPIGVSPLEQLGVTIRSEDSAQRYAEASYRNGARMGVGVVLEKGVTADDVTRNGLRDEIVARHGGLDAAFTPVILGGGVADVKPLGGQSAVEAELIAQRKVNREEVASVIGCPPPLMGILENATLANVGEFHKMLYRTTLGPPLELVRSEINVQLVARVPRWDGLFVEHELGEVLKGDPKERMEAYRIAIGAGVLTLNDVRQLENLEPYGDPEAEDNPANQPLVMANNVLPLSMVGQQLPGNLESSLTSTLEEMVANAVAAATA